MIHELKPIYDGRKSFYKKAFVSDRGISTDLFSYGSHVCSIIGNTLIVNGNTLWGTATTLRHIKEFVKQELGISMTKNDIKKHVQEVI